MQVRSESRSVADLVSMWLEKHMIPNHEYQRGIAWRQSQQQGFVDSIIRGYPVPAVFVQEVTTESPLGAMKRWEVVDGQQRLAALAGYTKGDYALLKPDDRKLALPHSLRALPAPWADRHFEELEEPLRTRLMDAMIHVYVIDCGDEHDEVRDLFIRLQKGTALSRQQIRDAWPGRLGPYIERLAGKLGRNPKCGLFRCADQRGQSSEATEVDGYVNDRVFAAQLLHLFMERQRDLCAEPGLGANALDRLYHTSTEFDTEGETARRFEELLRHTLVVVERILRRKTDGGGNHTVVGKTTIFVAFMLLQDQLRAGAALGPTYCGNLVRLLLNWRPRNHIRPSSGAGLAAAYEEFRNEPAVQPVLQLDARRCFDGVQKAQLFEAAGGVCAICGEAVATDEAEYDHYPVPYRDGGRTEVSNGRLVHAHCHRRGRPRLAE
jgi:hypothetical protein